MVKKGSNKVRCPGCGHVYTDRGLLNHVKKCKKLSPTEKETIKRIRELPH